MDGSESVAGFLLYFTTPQEAYRRVVEIEPEKQYIWRETPAPAVHANVLAGRSPRKGSEHLDEEWDGARDPLFTSALQVVREVSEANAQFEWDLKPMFRLQMAYLLLWSAIERFLSLKYHLSDEVSSKVQSLATEPAFIDKLRKLNPLARAVFRADDPRTKVPLTPEPSKAVAFYYQIRSNITHRGKGVVRDHDRVLTALQELLQLFEAVLEANFRGRWRAGQLNA